jgi:hypothetical protein
MMQTRAAEVVVVVVVVVVDTHPTHPTPRTPLGARTHQKVRKDNQHFTHQPSLGAVDDGL